MAAKRLLVIHRESWYIEARNGEEVAEDLIHAPEGMEEGLWEELDLTIAREGIVPEAAIKASKLYSRLVPDIVLPLFLKGELRVLPKPLLQYALFQADLEDPFVGVYLTRVGETLSEKGNVEELTKLEDRLDQLNEVNERKGLFDHLIFVARLISWGMPWSEAEDVLKAFRGPLDYHVGNQARLRDFEGRFGFSEASDFDYGYMRQFSWPGGPEEFEGDALRWKQEQAPIINVWSTFSEYFDAFPHREFWLALRDADTDHEVRQVLRA